MKTSVGQKTQEIAKLNPWWQSGSLWATTDLDLARVRQSGLGYEAAVLDGLLPGGLYTLRGPRRVGKTVAVKQRIASLLKDGAHPTSIVRIAADDWSTKDIRTLVQNIPLPPLPPKTQRYWFIDEVTSIQGDWARQIKWLRDNDEGFARATVVLTGSNAAGLTEAIGTLAGRRGEGNNKDRVLLPIGFKTFFSLVYGQDVGIGHEPLGIGDIHTPKAEAAYLELLPWLDRLVGAWELYLAYGGYPRSVASAKNGQAPDTGFTEDLFSVIVGDAFKNSRLAVADEMALIERIWQGMAAPLNTSSVAAEIGVSVDTVLRHIEYLRDAFLLWHCPQRKEDSWLARPRSQSKVYATDSLIARLAHLRNPARADIDLTVLSEMQLGTALQRRIISEAPRALDDSFLFFHRTPARKEIDFISEHLNGTAIESKYIDSGRWRSEAATLAATAWDGLFATRNVLDIEPKKPLWAVPTCILAYLIDT
jgi:predicted AAA+ superfamily ATPase